jgi:hypothetical protein
MAGVKMSLPKIIISKLLAKTKMPPISLPIPEAFQLQKWWAVEDLNL